MRPQRSSGRTRRRQPERAERSAGSREIQRVFRADRDVLVRLPRRSSASSRRGRSAALRRRLSVRAAAIVRVRARRARLVGVPPRRVEAQRRLSAQLGGGGLRRSLAGIGGELLLGHLPDAQEEGGDRRADDDAGEPEAGEAAERRQQDQVVGQAACRARRARAAASCRRGR